MPAREIITGMGPLMIKQPRVDNRAFGKYTCQRFASSILPRYLCRITSVDNFIPALHLKGISTNGFPAVLSAILGKGSKGLLLANIANLKDAWEQDYLKWRRRDLSGKSYVYL